MSRYIMALDAGTTSNRCILFDKNGEIVSVTQKEFTQYFPRSGWVEHDANEIWETQLAVAKEAMEKLGIGVDTALSIEVEDDTIVKRMSGRRTCKNCSATFHVVNNPPKKEGRCDRCGGELSIRKDDAPETVRARLETYHRETEPLMAFYEARGKLVKVNNRPTIEETTAAIRAALHI